VIDDRPHQIRHHDSPDESVRDNAAPVQQMRLTLSDRTLSIVALVFGSMALMGMLWALSEAHDAKRRADIDTMRVEGLTRAMIAHGIKDTYPHLSGEDD
jgi:hypothetical protein